jgi:hypothetical protein
MAPFFERREAAKPNPPKPTRSIAQVDGSGTPVVVMSNSNECSQLAKLAQGDNRSYTKVFDSCLRPLLPAKSFQAPSKHIYQIIAGTLATRASAGPVNRSQSLFEDRTGSTLQEAAVGGGLLIPTTQTQQPTA